MYFFGKIAIPNPGRIKIKVVGVQYRDIQHRSLDSESANLRLVAGNHYHNWIAKDEMIGTAIYFILFITALVTVFLAVSCQ